MQQMRLDLPIVKPAKWQAEGLKASSLDVKQEKPSPECLGGDNIDPKVVLRATA